MTKADILFKENIQNILNNGVFSQKARPKYQNGQTAHSKYITGSFATYNLSNGDFPITTLRPIPIKSTIKEMLWIYQDQSNSLNLLEDKYKVHYWNSWEVPNYPANNGDKRSIGERYGAIVKKHDIIGKLLKQLERNPWNRRNVISLWDYEASKKAKVFFRAPSKSCLMSDKLTIPSIWTQRLRSALTTCSLPITSTPCNMLPCNS